MHLAHMLDHLVLARETVLAPPMAIWIHAIDHRQCLAVVHDGDVALEVGVAGECYDAFCLVREEAGVDAVVDKWKETRFF